jgi:signal transduction histidine kinase/CheY-like chemotaxis protein
MVARWLAPLTLLLALTATTAAAAQGDAAGFDARIADAKAAMLSNPPKTVEHALAAERMADRLPPSQSRSVKQGTAIWLRGEALARMNDVAAAAPLIERAVRIASRAAPGSHLQGDALLASAWINTAQGDVAQALGDYQRAHAIFRAQGDTRSQAKALQSIGALYGDANDFTAALRYFDQALAVYKGDPMLALTLYNNRGNALKDLKRPREAEAQYARALALTGQMNMPLLRVLVLANIAEARLMSNDVTGAERAIDQGLRLSTRGEGAGFRKLLIASAAQAAFQRGQIDKAARLIGERFADEDLAKTTLPDREAHRTAYTIYRAAGEHDLALTHLAALKRLDDEATTLARSTSAALMAARFDFANQEVKIANLQRDEARRSVAAEQARTRTQRSIFLGVVGAIAVIAALLAAGIVTLRRSRNQVRAANDDLAVTNNALGKALAAKTEFLAMTSHEIRTPLNGILGMTEVMLADRNIVDATRDRLTVVHSAGVTMRTLVDDILDVAKIETGNLVIEKAPFDLKAMLVEASRLWEDQAEAKGLAFVRAFDDCPRMIVGDAVRLRQVVFNLMSNALKFTEHGRVTLTVDATDDRFRIWVADTGVGIPADKRDEIFESFRQADASTTRRFGGTGLGLTICRDLARAMGGDVTVSGEPGEGSCFTVDLPLIHAAACKALDARHDQSDCLLIVDRNPITRSMLKTLLAPHARGVALATTRDEALSMVEHGGVERMLVDATIIMEAADPEAAVAELATAGRDIPLILLWPAGTEAERAALVVNGRFTSIVKPISGSELVATMYPRGEAALVSQAA